MCTWASAVQADSAGFLALGCRIVLIVPPCDSQPLHPVGLCVRRGRLAFKTKIKT